MTKRPFNREDREDRESPPFTRLWAAAFVVECVECVECIAVGSIAILAWRRIVISIEVISIELAHEWYRRFLNLHQSITTVNCAELSYDAVGQRHLEHELRQLVELHAPAGLRADGQHVQGLVQSRRIDHAGLCRHDQFRELQ